MTITQPYWLAKDFCCVFINVFVSPPPPRNIWNADDTFVQHWLLIRKLICCWTPPSNEAPSCTWKVCQSYRRQRRLPGTPSSEWTLMWQTPPPTKWNWVVMFARRGLPWVKPSYGTTCAWRGPGSNSGTNAKVQTLAKMPFVKSPEKGTASEWTDIVRVWHNKNMTMCFLFLKKEGAGHPGVKINFIWIMCAAYDGMISISYD